MADLDLEIGTLELTIEAVRGHEHRLRPISDRALVLLQEMSTQQLLQAGVEVGSRRLQSVRAASVTLDLARTGNEDAARLLAAALLRGLVLQLGL